MKQKPTDRVEKWLCLILFTFFAFCWLYFFQQDLICASVREISNKGGDLYGPRPHLHLIVSVLLTAFASLWVIPVRKILHFKKGTYAASYFVSALFLGLITGFDGNSLFGQSYAVWIASFVFVVVLLLVCMAVSSVPKSDYFERPRTIAGNLLIMSLLFSLVGFLGNTDENLHRRLRMEHLYAEGKYNELLDVGRMEEESDHSIDLLRAKALLNIPFDANPLGSMIGERLFEFSISDPVSLSKELAKLDNAQAYLVSCLLTGNIDSFRDSINLKDYSVVPKYFMQALVLAHDNAAMTLFSRQFKAEQLLLESFTDKLEPIKDKPQSYRANSTFIDYHSTYYWYSFFRTGYHN